MLRRRIIGTNAGDDEADGERCALGGRGGHASVVPLCSILVARGTPLECTNCGLWKSLDSFEEAQRHPNKINTRVCEDCVERRKCKGVCGEAKTQENFTAAEWQHARWPSYCAG